VHKPYTNMAAAPQLRPWTAGGIGTQPGLDDVARLASAPAPPVQLDPAAAERMKKASPPPKSFQPEQPADVEQQAEPQQAATDQRPFVRAVLATKLLQLLAGQRSGVRLQVAEYLAALLNADVLPQLAWGSEDRAVLAQVADCCHGRGACCSSGAPLEASLVAAGIEAPRLSSSERLVLEGGAAASAGMGALVVQAGKRLMAMAHAGAALSMEAVGMQVRARGVLACRRAFPWGAVSATSGHPLKGGAGSGCANPCVHACEHLGTLADPCAPSPSPSPVCPHAPSSASPPHAQPFMRPSQVKMLDADVMEAQGYKAAAGVADELRSLLEGSKRVGSLKAGESEALGDAFNAAAQVCTGWECGTGQPIPEGFPSRPQVNSAGQL